MNGKLGNVLAACAEYARLAATVRKAKAVAEALEGCPEGCQCVHCLDAEYRALQALIARAEWTNHVAGAAWGRQGFKL